MNDKIKERLALYKLLLSFNLLAIFGVIGWLYNIYEEFGAEETKFGFLILLIFFAIAIIFFYKIRTLIEKL
jgi:hypothetical protein